MAELPIPDSLLTTVGPASLIPWDKAQLSRDGRFLIVRKLRPRLWLLYDLNYWSCTFQTPNSLFIGAFQTRQEARMFIDNLIAKRAPYSYITLNQGTNNVRVETEPSPVWTAPPP